MDAGIEVNDEVLKKFNELKFDKSHKYLIAKIENKKEIIVEKTGDKDATYANIMEDLEKGEPRFIIYDFNYLTNDQPPMHKNTLSFIYWSPDNASAQNKLMYATAKENFKGKLSGLQADLTANDIGEIDQTTIEDQLKL